MKVTFIDFFIGYGLGIISAKRVCDPTRLKGEKA